MFTENEIDGLISFPAIKDATANLKKKFIAEEAPYLEIDDHDFLSLVMLTPSVGISLANGSVSLFEEIALNKKARKLSKGGYWMKKDPVVVSMGHFIEHFDKWSDLFYEHLKFVMQITFNRDEIMKSNVSGDDVSDVDFCIEILRSPFIFIRFLTSFFLDDEDEDIVSERRISKVEKDRILEIAEKVDFHNIPLFVKFASKLVVK